MSGYRDCPRPLSLYRSPWGGAVPCLVLGSIPGLNLLNAVTTKSVSRQCQVSWAQNHPRRGPCPAPAASPPRCHLAGRDVESIADALQAFKHRGRQTAWYQIVNYPDATAQIYPLLVSCPACSYFCLKIHILLSLDHLKVTQRHFDT